MKGFIAAVFLAGLMSSSAVAQGPALDGTWKATFADSVSSGSAFLYLSTESDGTVSGKYLTTQDTEGAVTGRIEGRVFHFTLIQMMEDCPGSLSGTLTLQGQRGVGTYAGRDCRGEHENGVISIERSAEEGPAATPISKLAESPDELLLPKEVAEDRKMAETNCPGCPRIFIAYIDSDTGAVEDWWLSDNQSKWIKEYKKKGWKGKGKPRFWFTGHRANAEYIFIWTQAMGSRPYIYYVPRTETETQRVSGVYSGATEKSDSSGSGGRRRASQSSEPDRTTGSFQGTVQVEKKSTQEMQGSVNFVDAVLTIWDARSGKKLHETRKRGTLRWSKPEKDCLEDAMEFLYSLRN
jgi:hypothetical protein